MTAHSTHAGGWRRRLALLALCLSLSAASLASERNVARLGELQASVSERGWCGATVAVQLSAPRPEALSSASRELQLLAGGVRQLLSLECPALRTLELTGRVEGQAVAHWRQHPDGRLQALALPSPSTAGAGAVATAPTPATPTSAAPTASPTPAAPATYSAPLTQAQRIAETQALLTRLGYSPGPVDGLMGRRTRTAIAAFLRAHGLPPTNRVDATLLAQLRGAHCGNPAGCPDPAVAAGGAPSATPGTAQPGAVAAASGSPLAPSEPAVSAPATNAAPAILPPGLSATLPTRQGRLLLGTPHIDRELIPPTAAEWLGQAALLMALQQAPELLDDDDRAFGYYQLLDTPAQQTIAMKANVSPDKVVDSRQPLRRLGLDEFERRALLAQIRRDVPPLLAARTPPLPLPILLVCPVGFAEYDFDAEAFSVIRNSLGGAFCHEAPVRLSRRGTVIPQGINITAPLPIDRLPTTLSVPMAEAQRYKAQHLTPAPGQGSRRIGMMHASSALYAIEAQLTALNPLPNRSRQPTFAFEVDVEGIQLFQNRDTLGPPFARLAPLPLPSLASVPAHPDGPVFLNDAETPGLLLLAHEQLTLDDHATRRWIRTRLHDRAMQSEYRRLGRPLTPWATFITPSLVEELRPPDAEPPAWLIRNFAEWTRARAAALPDTLWLNTARASRDGLTGDDSSDLAPVFREPHSRDTPRYTALAQRLGVQPNQLVPLNSRNQLLSVAGLEDDAELVIVLPAPRGAYTLPLPASPPADPTANHGYITLSAALDIRAVTLHPAEPDTPLLVIEATPASGHATTQTPDGARQEIATATFDSVPAAVAEAAPTDAPPRVTPQDSDTPQPFTAELADLLQLKFLPETVDDALLRRMLRSRFGYERNAPEPLRGGRFFTDVTQPLDPAQVTQQLAAFRAWSLERTRHLPDRLTTRLRLRNGVVENEAQRTMSRNHGIDCGQDRDTGETLTEQQSLQRRLCDFIDAAWARPDPIIWLDQSHSRRSFPAHRGLGPRFGDRVYGDCQADVYCKALKDAARSMEPRAGERIHYRDLVRLDRLPVLDAEHRRLAGDLALEIEFRPTAAQVPEQWPDRVGDAALRQATPFAERFGLALPRPPEPVANPPHTLLFEATTLAARLIDRDSGAVRAELALAEPEPLPLALLSPPQSPPAFDVLGITLGMSFADAEARIRDHMTVGRVLVADRAQQATTLSGELAPYSSGRLFLSADERELITLFDEPPAAPEQVLAIRRQMRLPPRSLNLIGLKTSLEQRYGEPVIAQSTEQGQRRGLEFLWAQFEPSPSCQGPSPRHEPDIWLEADGTPAAPPTSIGQHYYPSFASGRFQFQGVDGQQPPPHRFCPLQLGVRITQPVQAASQTRYTSPDQGYDEIVVWLHDQRRYAERYADSLARSDELIDSAAADSAGDSAITF